MSSVRDLEIIPMTRQQLVDLLFRVHIAEGMKVEQARIHAEMLVDQYIRSLTPETRLTVAS